MTEQTLSGMVRNFLAAPFDPNQDGKTDALELALALGLVVVLAFAWSRVISWGTS